MQLRASTAYWEMLVDKLEASAAQSIQRAFADGKQLGAKLETGRQVWNQPDLQDKGWASVEPRGPEAQSIDKTSGKCKPSGQDHTAHLETVGDERKR